MAEEQEREYQPPENLTKLRSDWSTKQRSTIKRRNRRKKWAGPGWAAGTGRGKQAGASKGTADVPEKNEPCIRRVVTRMMMI